MSELERTNNMDQITSIITSSAMSILVVLTGIVGTSGQEILTNAKRWQESNPRSSRSWLKTQSSATEQVADKLDIHGKDKLEHAKTQA